MNQLNEELVRSRLGDWSREAARLGRIAQARRAASSAAAASGPAARRPVASADSARGWAQVATR